MESIYIVCFILLGIGGVGDLVALIFLILSVIDGCCGSMSKSDFSNSSFQVFLRIPVAEVDNDTVSLDSRETGEQNETIDN